MLISLLATAALLAAAPAPPPVDAQVDYQLGGAHQPEPGVEVVARDRTERVAPGRYNICYVNAYQTQPGELGWWRDHRPQLLLRRHDQLVHDPGWRREVLLDTSTAANRRGIARVVARWISGCADDGFDAVEPDNLDSFTRSRHLLDRADNLALARRLATGAAHRADLAIAQKNLAGLNQIERRRIGFDFAVAEECAVYRECGSYTSVYGRHVLEIEYTDNGRRAYRRACRTHGDELSIVLRDRNLRSRSEPGYMYRAC